MPAWLLRIIATLGVPALKILLKVVLRGLEQKYPGIAPLVDAIIRFLDGGGSAEELHDHCEAFPEFCGAQLKHE